MFWSTPSADMQYPNSPTHLAFRAAQYFITLYQMKKAEAEIHHNVTKTVSMQPQGGFQFCRAAAFIYEHL